MKHAIDPKIDCVFKAILGAEAHKNLLIDFLNAMLEGSLSCPIQQVELLNPYNEKESLTDKLSIVDVKARDQQGAVYQIEIQLMVYPSLLARMLYTWADLYSGQLQSGNDYAALNPTYSVWLVDELLFAKDARYYRQFAMRDEQGAVLVEQGRIVVVELPKFHAALINTPQQRWVQFFNEAETFTDPAQLPGWMHTPEMEQAMSVLEQFSEKEASYHQYQARQNYLREQATIRKDMIQLQHRADELQDRADELQDRADEAEKMVMAEREAKEAEREAKEVALAKAEAERASKEAAIIKIQALEQLLASLGKKPESE